MGSKCSQSVPKELIRCSKPIINLTQQSFRENIGDTKGPYYPHENVLGKVARRVASEKCFADAEHILLF
jgi:hypothetical protein